MECNCCGTSDAQEELYIHFLKYNINDTIPFRVCNVCRKKLPKILSTDLYGFIDCLNITFKKIPLPASKYFENSINNISKEPNSRTLVDDDIKLYGSFGPCKICDSKDWGSFISYFYTKTFYSKTIYFTTQPKYNRIILCEPCYKKIMAYPLPPPRLEDQLLAFIAREKEKNLIKIVKLNRKSKLSNEIKENPDSNSSIIKINEEDKSKPVIKISKQSIVFNKLARKLLDNPKSIELSYDKKTHLIRIRSSIEDKGLIIKKTKVFAKGFMEHFRITAKGPPVSE